MDEGDFTRTRDQRGTGKIGREGLGFADRERELLLDFGDGLGGGEFGPAGDNRIAIWRSHQDLGDTDGGGTHARVIMGHAGEDGLGLHGTAAFERPQGVHPAHRGGGILGERDQRGVNRSVRGGFDEQALGGLAAPRITAGEFGDEFGRAHRGKFLGWGDSGAFGGNAPDASERERLVEATLHNLLAEVGGQRNAVLDDAAVEVDDVEGAVGAREQVNRTEALVGRSQELRLVVIRGGHEGAAFGLHHVALDEITRGLAHESVAVGVGREEVGPVDPGCAGGRKLLKLELAEHLWAIAAVDAGVDANRPDQLFLRDLPVQARGTAEVRVTIEIGRRDDVGTHLVAVAVMVEVAEVVLRKAPLPAEVAQPTEPAAILELEAGRVGADVEPVIVTPEQRVRGAFGISELRAGGIDAHAEVRRHFDLRVGLAVAVRVAAEPEMGRSADQHAIAVEGDCAGHHDLIEENRGRLEDAVAVLVLEHHHAAMRLVFRRTIEVRHVALHLDDPETTVRAKLRRHRVADLRVAGGERDLVTLRNLESLQFFLGRARRRRRDQVIGYQRHHRFASLVTDLAKRGSRQAKGGQSQGAAGHAHMTPDNPDGYRVNRPRRFPRTLNDRSRTYSQPGLTLQPAQALCSS